MSEPDVNALKMVLEDLDKISGVVATLKGRVERMLPRPVVPSITPPPVAKKLASKLWIRPPADIISPPVSSGSSGSSSDASVPRSGFMDLTTLDSMYRINVPESDVANRHTWVNVETEISGDFYPSER